MVMQRQIERLMKVRQAAADLDLAEVTLRSWMAKRKIRYVKMGRAVRIPEGR
jgi:excisionase family DNA binding protein